MKVKSKDLQFISRVFNVAAAEDLAHPEWGVVRLAGKKGATALRVSSTDTVMAATVALPVEEPLTQNIDIKVPARMFSTYIRSLPSEECQITVKDSKLDLVSGSLKARISTRNDLEVYPFLLEDSKDVFSTTYGTLTSLLGAVDWVTKLGGDRPQFANPHMVNMRSGVEFVGIHSAMVFAAQSNLATEFMFDSITIPSRFVSAVNALHLDADEVVTVQVNEKLTRIALLIPDKFFIVTPLVNQQLPPYAAVLNRRSDNTVVHVLGGALKEKINRLNALAQAERSTPIAEMRIKNGEWSIAMNGVLISADDYFLWEDVELDTNIESIFHVNLAYLSKALSKFDAPTVDVYLPPTYNGDPKTARPLYLGQGEELLFAVHQTFPR